MTPQDIAAAVRALLAAAPHLSQHDVLAALSADPAAPAAETVTVRTYLDTVIRPLYCETVAKAAEAFAAAGGRPRVRKSNTYRTWNTHWVLLEDRCGDLPLTAVRASMLEG